jgi:hypothetical protein
MTNLIIRYSIKKLHNQTNMRIFVKPSIISIFILLICTATSCLGLKNQVGHTKFEMLNKLGTPSQVINHTNGDQIYVYFYEDYSQNHYPSVVGFMYVDKSEMVYKVEKYKTRLSLGEFLRYR